MKFVSGNSLTHRANLTTQIEQKIAQKFANLHKKVPILKECYIGEADNEHILSKFVFRHYNFTLQPRKIVS